MLNFLFPSVGAALVRILPLDSFLFMCSNAAVAVLGTGLAIHAYLANGPLCEWRPLKRRSSYWR